MRDQLANHKYKTATFNLENHQEYIDRHTKFEFSPIYEISNEINFDPDQFFSETEAFSKFQKAKEFRTDWLEKKRQQDLEAQRVRDLATLGQLMKKYQDEVSGLDINKI